MPKKAAPVQEAQIEIIKTEQPIEPASLILSNERFVMPSTLDMFDRLAPVLARSRLLGVMRAEEAYAIMLKGYEIGLSITASFEFVQVIQGKPSLSPRGAMALLLNNNAMEKPIINRLADAKGTFLGYECTMTRRDNGFTYTAKFTMEMAMKAGLVKADSGWAKYEENMCLWRAVGFAADVVAPDITAGMTTLMKMPEHYGVNLTEAGDVVDVTPIQSQPVTVSRSMNDLLSKWTPEQILTANDGKIPAISEEVEAVWQKLEAAQ